MPDYSRNRLLFLFLLHVALGYLLLFAPFPRILGTLPTPLILLLVVLNRNKNEEAMLGSAYIAGLEVIWRITFGYVTYEFAKYSITAILLTAKLVEDRRNRPDKRILMYALSFSPGALIALMSLPEAEKVRQLSAILSGPICLIACVIYFSGRSISYHAFINTLRAFGFTLVTLLVLLFLKTPSLELVSFQSQSNFETSGGFGPNQVSSVLGLGMLISTILLWQGRRLSGWLILDSLVMILLAYRAFLTFSRGGIVASIIGVFFFFLAVVTSSRLSWPRTVRLAIFLLFGAISFLFLWDRLATITEGQVVNRFTGRDSFGRLSTNITSGRQFIAQNELQLFRENPLLGVGLSYSKFIRLQQSSSFVNTHNEITRTLAEQGLIGAIGIIALVSISLKAYRRRNSLNRATFWALGAFFLVTLSSIAMRLSATSFVFGLAIVFVTQSRPPLPNWHSRNTQLRMAR